VIDPFISDFYQLQSTTNPLLYFTTFQWPVLCFRQTVTFGLKTWIHTFLYCPLPIISAL